MFFLIQFIFGAISIITFLFHIGEIIQVVGLAKICGTIIAVAIALQITIALITVVTLLFFKGNK